MVTTLSALAIAGPKMTEHPYLERVCSPARRSGLEKLPLKKLNFLFNRPVYRDWWSVNLGGRNPD